MEALREWALRLPSEGRYTFTTAEARAHQAHISAAGTAVALQRAADDGILVSPVRGFHVVLPLEDRAIGAPQWRLFLGPLMAHLGGPYYVGLLTAAAIHGAAGQAAQVVQVVTAKQRRPIRVGRLRIELVVRRTAADAPTIPLTTPSGRIPVATPEVVALDLVHYPEHAGGWGNVLTVLHGLAPRLGARAMRAALAMQPATTDMQRLGHLLDRVGAARPSDVLAHRLAGRRTTWIPLVPGAAPADPGTYRRDPRWRVVVNEELAAD